VKTSAFPFETLYRKYDAWYEREPGKSLFAIELKALRQVLDWRGSRCLEIGVGSGRFAEGLSIRFGVDPAFQPLILAKQRGLRVVKGKGETLPFPAYTFDACLLMVTLCFVKDAIEVLRETFRVLKSGGQVVLGMVLRESPWGLAYQRRAMKGHPFYARATFYDASQVRDMLEKTGFQSVITFSTLFQPPGRLRYTVEVLRRGHMTGAGFTVFRAEKPEE